MFIKIFSHCLETLLLYLRPALCSKSQVLFRAYIMLECSLFSWCRQPSRLGEVGIRPAPDFYILTNPGRVQFVAFFSVIFAPKMIQSHGFKGTHMLLTLKCISTAQIEISSELQMLSTSLFEYLLGISKSELLIPLLLPLACSFNLHFSQ